jgi:hypothetical protein
MSDARQRSSEAPRLSEPGSEGDRVFGSAMADAARRTASHFGGRDAGEAAPPDAIELWGRRIGRALSLVVCIALGVYLYVTYLR